MAESLSFLVSKAPSKLRCEDIAAAFGTDSICEETDMGLRYTTHCLYPSFDPVAVFIVRVGDGIVVHDGGGAAQSVWLHGRDNSALNKSLKEQAVQYHLAVNDGVLSLEIKSDDWLPQAILAVANASAAVAWDAIEAAHQAQENAIHEIIHGVLRAVVREDRIADGFDMRGKSGKHHHFDFAVREPKGITLIGAVAPHHVSVAAKYLSFSDTKGFGEEIRGRFIVHEKPLEEEDVNLLLQCADVVPATAMKQRFTKYFSR